MSGKISPKELVGYLRKLQQAGAQAGNAGVAAAHRTRGPVAAKRAAARRAASEHIKGAK